MKENRLNALLPGLLLGLFAVLQFTTIRAVQDKYWAGDLRLRRNEICAAHIGINSFRIWNREITVPNFAPLPRPDKPSIQPGKDDKVVHAYPPWHTFLFYFYGWIPERMCVSLMSLLFGVCICFIVKETINIVRSRANNYWSIAIFALAMIIPSVWNCFFLLNYGVLILAALLLMNKALERDKMILAGIAWSFMMIKPQVGLLFFWPLLFGKKYKTIITAIALCSLSTLAASFIVKESFFDLILQVPKIGSPYPGNIFTEVLIKPIIGSTGNIIWMALFFVVAGFLVWLLSDKKDFLFSCMPVAATIPIWTYSCPHDHVILLVDYIFFGIILSRYNSKRWFVLGYILLASIIFLRIWGLAFRFSLFDPTGIGWIYQAVQASVYIQLFLVVCMIIHCVRCSKKQSVSSLTTFA